jgi:hypothetical protein
VDSKVDRTKRKKFDELSDSTDSSNHTPAQRSKRQRSTPERRQSKYGLSDHQTQSAKNLLDARTRKRGVKRPRIQWDLVSSWKKMHVAQDEYEGEIARITAKSLYDAEINLTGDLGLYACQFSNRCECPVKFRVITTATDVFIYTHGI